MRILLDACVPRVLGPILIGHNVATISEIGLQDTDDGDMLNAIAGQCEIFLTVDKNLPKQQRLKHRPFGVLVVRGRSNRIEDLVPLMPQILSTLSTLRPADVVEMT